MIVNWKNLPPFLHRAVPCQDNIESKNLNTSVSYGALRRAYSFLFLTSRVKLDLAQGRRARGEEGLGDCDVDPQGT